MVYVICREVLECHLLWVIMRFASAKVSGTNCVCFLNVCPSRGGKQTSFEDAWELGEG